MTPSLQPASRSRRRRCDEILFCCCPQRMNERPRKTFLDSMKKSGAGTQVVVGENVGSLWGKNQHFPHIIPTYSQQMINILPTTTFDQLWPNKLSYNCPCLNKFTSSYPQLNQHFVNGPITYQLTPFSCQFLKYGECWENVEVGRMLMSLVCLKPNMTLSIEWGECWVNVEVGRMLRRC